MKVSHFNGSIEVVAEGETQKDVFRQLSAMQEVFEHSECGACGGDNLRFVVRTVEDNDFYEIQCKNSKCRAKLAFGQHKGKEGTLFPKRKDEKGNWLANGGWTVWKPEAKEQE